MASLPHSTFTTDILPEKDRFAAWREDMSTIFDVDKAPIVSEDPYHATFDLFHFGHSVLAHLKASPGRYVRTPKKAARDGLDAILLQLFLEGGVQFGFGSRTTYANAGDIVVFDLAQRVDNINTKFRHITAMWVRSSIEEVLPDIARWHGHSLPRGNPAVALLRRHMTSCYEMAPDFSTAEGSRVEAATLSLVSAAMAGSELTTQTEVQPAMAEMITYQIKRYIRENLGSPNLSPGLIAQQFGISRTRLYELLEPVGGIANYQRHLRLLRCLNDLQNPAKAHLQIAEIAYNNGFSQVATFNRNFRKAFGFTPGEARVKALDGDQLIHTASPTSHSKKKSSKEHHQWFQAVGI